MQKNKKTLVKLLISATFLTACGGGGGGGTSIADTTIPKELTIPFFSDNLKADTKKLFAATVDDLDKLGKGKIFQSTDSFKDGMATFAHGVFQDMRKNFTVDSAAGNLEDIDELDEFLTASGINPNMDVKSALMKIPNSAFVISEEAKQKDESLRNNTFNTFQVKDGVASLDLAVDLSSLMAEEEAAGTDGELAAADSSVIVEKAGAKNPEFTHTFRLALNEAGFSGLIETLISSIPTLKVDETTGDIFKQVAANSLTNLNSAVLPHITVGEVPLNNLFSIGLKKIQDEIVPDVQFKTATLKDTGGKTFVMTPENSLGILGLSMNKIGEDIEKYFNLAFPQIVKNLPEEIQFYLLSNDKNQKEIYSGDELARFKEKAAVWNETTQKKIEALKIKSIQKLFAGKLAGNPYDYDADARGILSKLVNAAGEISDLSMLDKTSKFKLFYYGGFWDGDILLKKLFKTEAEKASFKEEFKKWEQKMQSESKKAFALFGASTKLSSTRSARLGTSVGEIDLRQTSYHNKTALKLPLFIKLNGDVSNLSNGEGVEGSALVKVGNALFGLNQTYSTQGKGFAKNSNYQETSMVSTFMFGKAFTELNAGIVEANNVKKSKWSGFKQVATVGYDFDSGFSPFVQAFGRQLNKDNQESQKEIGAFAGVSYDISNEYGNFFKHSSLFTLKTGAISSNMGRSNNTRLENSVDINHGVKFQNGVSFDTNMQLSSSSNALVKISVGFSQ